MKVYKHKKEVPISAFLILVLFIALDFYQPMSDNNLLGIIAKLMLLSAIIVPLFCKVIIDDNYVEVKYPFTRKKLQWNEIGEIKNHPWSQTFLNLIPSKESGKKKITIPLNMLEGNILNDIADHVDANKIKCTLFVEKE